MTWRFVLIPAWVVFLWYLPHPAVLFRRGTTLHFHCRGTNPSRFPPKSRQLLWHLSIISVAGWWTSSNNDGCGPMSDLCRAPFTSHRTLHVCLRIENTRPAVRNPRIWSRFKRILCAELQWRANYFRQPFCGIIIVLILLCRNYKCYSITDTYHLWSSRNINKALWSLFVSPE
jgi:hypothetical protein